MALTMTRTRTQTTLTRLVALLANLNGELAFLDDLLARNPGFAEGLACRWEVLIRDRAAVQVTVSQFDEAIGLEQIGGAAEWARPYGGRRSRSLVSRYRAAHMHWKLPE